MVEGKFRVQLKRNRKVQVGKKAKLEERSPISFFLRGLSLRKKERKQEGSGKMSDQQAGIFTAVIGIVLVIVAAVLWIYDKIERRKYTGRINGTVIGHRWRHTENMSYPCAVVSYWIDGREYQCVQKYRAILYNSVKHARVDWEIDEKYRLHRYQTRKCEYHVNPIDDWFPVNSQMHSLLYPGKTSQGILRGTCGTGTRVGAPPWCGNRTLRLWNSIVVSSWLTLKQAFYIETKHRDGHRLYSIFGGLWLYLLGKSAGTQVRRSAKFLAV